MRRHSLRYQIVASILAIGASSVATPVSAQLISIDATLLNLDARVTVNAGRITLVEGRLVDIDANLSAVIAAQVDADARVSLLNNALASANIRIDANVRAIADLDVCVGGIEVDVAAAIDHNREQDLVLADHDARIDANGRAIVGLDGRVGQLEGDVVAGIAKDIEQDGRLAEHSTRIDAAQATASAAFDHSTTLRADVEAGRVGLVRQDAATGAISIGAQTGGSVFSLAGTDGNRRLTGIADGGAANDAATVGQVERLASATLSASRAYTDQSVAAMFDTSMAATRTMIGENNRVLRADMNALAANGSALSGLAAKLPAGQGHGGCRDRRAWRRSGLRARRIQGNRKRPTDRIPRRSGDGHPSRRGQLQRQRRISLLTLSRSSSGGLRSNPTEKERVSERPEIHRHPLRGRRPTVARRAPAVSHHCRGVCVLTGQGEGEITRLVTSAGSRGPSSRLRLRQFSIANSAARWTPALRPEGDDKRHIRPASYDFANPSQLAHATHRRVGQGEVFKSRGRQGMTTNSGTTSYRLGGAAALLAGFLICWVNVAVGIVGEDDPSNLGFFGVVVTAAACAFVARFRAQDMARAMLASAAVQAWLAVVILTAPSTTPDGARRVVIATTGLLVLWSSSAALFHRSARQVDERTAS